MSIRCQSAPEWQCRSTESFSAIRSKFHEKAQGRFFVTPLRSAKFPHGFPIPLSGKNPFDNNYPYSKESCSSVLSNTEDEIIPSSMHTLVHQLIPITFRISVGKKPPTEQVAWLWRCCKHQAITHSFPQPLATGGNVTSGNRKESQMTGGNSENWWEFIIILFSSEKNN